MNCIYHRWRTKDYRKYRFCTLNKQVILNNCQNCLFRQPHQYKAMKKKSNKLSKLEKERFSILTDDLEHCYACKFFEDKNIKRDDLHEIYQGKNRQICMKNGFVAPLCRGCHENENIKLWLKKICEHVYLKNHTKEEFRRLVENDYLNKQKGNSMWKDG